MKKVLCFAWLVLCCLFFVSCLDDPTHRTMQQTELETTPVAVSSPALSTPLPQTTVKPSPVVSTTPILSSSAPQSKDAFPVFAFYYDYPTSDPIAIHHGTDVIGAKKNGIWDSWENFYWGEPGLVYNDYAEKYMRPFELFDSEVITTNSMFQEGDPVVFYGNGEKHKGEMEKGVMLSSYGVAYCSTSFLTYEPTLFVKNKFYIGVTGDWDAQPRKGKVIDKQGSFRIDLDGNGMDDTLWVVVDDSNQYSMRQEFYIEYNGVKQKMERFNDVWSAEYSLEIISLDADGDGILELFAFSRFEARAQLEMYSFDYNITKNKLFYFWGE